MDLKRFLRLNKAEFDAVYSKIRFRLEGHCPTHLRPIQGTERLAVFLRFIAFGPSCCAVAHLFAIGDSTVFEICKEVSEAIVSDMQAECLPHQLVRHGKEAQRDSAEFANFRRHWGYRWKTYCSCQTGLLGRIIL
uniref:Transposase n=1 Tax=Ditylenchus dipsaci TaxID=166011 RepID=A0A915CTB2_9BILA